MAPFLPEDPEHKVIAFINGGVLESMYTNIPGPINVVLWDEDNIEAGDPPPDDPDANEIVYGDSPNFRSIF